MASQTEYLENTYLTIEPNKAFPIKEATLHLKKSLRGSYKQAVKQIDERLDDLNRLRELIEANVLPVKGGAYKSRR